MASETEDDEVELTADQAFDLIDHAMTAVTEARVYAADEIDDAGFDDRHLGDILRKGISEADPAKRRRQLGMYAANVAEDRYGAGSQAAGAALRIALTCGFRAALDFARDLQHHEVR